jgi:hypothetical protein
MSETRDTKFERKHPADPFHFVVAVNIERGMMSFCCATQPLATVRSFGPPLRCPFCRRHVPWRLSLSN